MLIRALARFADDRISVRWGVDQAAVDQLDLASGGVRISSSYLKEDVKIKSKVVSVLKMRLSVHRCTRIVQS